MKVRAPKNKKALNLAPVNKIFSGFALLVLTVLFAAKVNAQATCIGIIDSTKTEFCFSGNSITFSNAVASGEHIQWLTSGDGTFSDPFAEKPTYTVGPGDSANGYVFIYLDVYKDDPVNFCSALPVATLHLANMRTTGTPSYQSICSNTNIVPVVMTSGLSSTTYTWTRDNTFIGGSSPASGTGNPRGTLVNNTTAPVLVTYTITPTAATCQGTPVTATVLVNPRVNATATPTTQTICSASTITPIALTSNISGTTFSWTRNKTDSVTGIAASGTGSITGALTNTNTVPVTVTFTITPTANGCAGAAITATVVVNPTATVITSNPALQTICSGTAISSIISSGGTGGTVYNWTRNNTAQATGIAASGSGNITGVLTNTTAAPVYVTFTVTPTSSSCANRATVLVNPRPVAVATPSTQTICSGSNLVPVALTSATSGTTFNWTRDNAAAVTGIAASGSGNISGALVNTTNAPVTVIFTITPTVNGCTGTAITASVTVNPRPTSLISGDYSICAGTPSPNINIAFTGAGPWNVTYSEGTTPVTVNGINSNSYSFPAPSNPCTFTVTALSDARCAAIAPGMTGSATITQVSYPVVATAGANGVISPADTSYVSCGSSKAYTITPNSGFSIQDVLVDGVSEGAIATYTFTNVASAHSISATFSSVITGQTITASAEANGTITPSGAVNVSSGGNQIFAIAADSCYQVADVLVDGVSQGAVTSYSFTNVTASHTISASFAQLSYAVTASADANGGITPAGVTNIACGGSQTYTITADSCYQIADVLVDGVSVGAVSTYTFSNINAAHTISASFVQLSYSITASTGVNGTITPNGTTNVSCAANQTYTITPASCYQIADVLVDGVSVGAVSTYTFSTITATHTISASFTPLTYAITASAGTNGTITPVGATAVNCGTIQVYTITPNSGYEVQTVLVDGVSQGAISSYSFTNVTATHTISVTFVAVVGCTVPTLSTTVTNVLCRNSNTGAVTVTATGGTAPFTYAWTGPNGFTASTKDISGLAAGTYNLVVTATGGCTTNRSLTITQPAAALTATATAGTITCVGRTTTLSVTASGGTGARQYSLNGGTFQSANGFIVNAAGSPYTVTVRDANLCTTTTNTVTVADGTATVPAQPTSVSGPVYNLCGGGTFTYTVNPVPDATSYTWTPATNTTILSGQGTTQIQLSISSTFTTVGGIGVAPRNGCGGGTSYRFSIFAVQAFPASAITGPSSVTIGQANVQYSLPFIAGLTYNWFVPSGASVTAGQGTNVATIKFGSFGGNVGVEVVNACGTAPRINKSVSMVAARAAATTAKEISPEGAPDKTYLTVYPNPAQNFATVEFGATRAGVKFEIVISNTLGETLVSKSGMSIAGKNTLRFDLDKYSSGIYLVRLLTGKEIQTQKLVKEK